MSNLKAIYKERSRRNQELTSKLSDTEQLVKKMQTMENTLKSMQKERDSWKDKFESFQGTVTKKDIRDKILGIASAKNAVDPEDILYRFESKVKIAEDRMFLDGSEKTIEEDIESFLASKPHLVKASPVEAKGSNAGSAASPFPATGSPQKKVDVTTNEGASEFARSFVPPNMRPR